MTKVYLTYQAVDQTDRTWREHTHYEGEEHHANTRTGNGMGHSHWGWPGATRSRMASAAPHLVGNA